MTTIGEQPLIPTTGKWVWKDGDKPCLEFVSNNPGAERHDNRRRDRKKNLGDRRAEKGGTGTPTLGARPYARAPQNRAAAGGKSPKQGGKQSEHTHVTLEDVKGVAYEKTISELEEIPKDFDYMFSTDQFDDFLMCLLNYFQCFFEKRTHEQKPNPMNIEPSEAEKKYYADLCSKVSISQKILGQAYCVLVLGVGMEYSHHMACGLSRVSNTYRDRDMYETLYRFCSFAVWITFRRREYEVVKIELNRTLRSETFNPAIRVKNAPDSEPTEDGGEGEKEEKKISPADYRRLYGKRPPIKSIINQRSPALVSILPSPKEEAPWLFKKKLYATGNLDNSEEDEVDLLEHIKKLNLDPRHFKMGIIGELMSNYNPITLTPKGTEHEEEENDEDEKSARRESTIHHASTPRGKTSQLQHQELGISRQVTGVSQVTTEAPSEDD